MNFAIDFKYYLPNVIFFRASPSYHAYDEDGFKPPIRDKDSDEEEVPWWAEFDKTYEVEKKKLEEEKRKLEEEEKAIKGKVEDKSEGFNFFCLRNLARSPSWFSYIEWFLFFYRSTTPLHHFHR